ncbi:hypothetical protein GH810_04730 [Acetobacterium paludosum]|uniref:Uncharacterized protein n=1 Tax=Acetobacterium paludosum TaxID=52693 RepID=A0A923I1Z4_9FIRM|nr:hypothetical protein [Acetobacterium paludosum]MBC3887610.1 hypothetical protein [Acetobacterium paludosum]
MIDNKCDRNEYEHYRDGECLDKRTLKDQYKATGCLICQGCNQEDP